MSAFDYKKEYKQLYQPKNKPELIQGPGRIRVSFKTVQVQ